LKKEKEQKMVVEQKFFIGLRDIDFKNNLKIKSMLSFLEDVGGIHSNKVGYGLLDIPEKKRSWILLNWKVKFLRRPHYAETLNVTTWATGMDRLYAYRDFEVYDEEGKTVAIASSKWVCFDTEKMAIAKIDDVLGNAYTTEEKHVFDTPIEKLKEQENYSDSCEIKITKDMIDVNGHVHNLNYIDFVSQIMPYSVMQNAMNVEVLYKKEIKEDAIIKCLYKQEDDVSYAVIKSQDETVLHAIIKIS
jgi:medium-chain acyl-[acyl-carrier-protein] hydrolase